MAISVRVNCKTRSYISPYKLGVKRAPHLRTQNQPCMACRCVSGTPKLDITQIQTDSINRGLGPCFTNRRLSLCFPSPVQAMPLRRYILSRFLRIVRKACLLWPRIYQITIGFYFFPSTKLTLRHLINF